MSVPRAGADGHGAGAESGAVRAVRAGQASSRYSTRNITIVTNTAVRMSESTSVAKRIEPALVLALEIAAQRALLGVRTSERRRAALAADLGRERLLEVVEGLTHSHGLKPRPTGVLDITAAAARAAGRHRRQATVISGDR